MSPNIWRTSFFEFVIGIVFKGIYEFRDKIFGGNVKHLEAGVVLFGVILHRAQKVSFSQSRLAVNKQRIVLPRLTLGNGLAGGIITDTAKKLFIDPIKPIKLNNNRVVLYVNNPYEKTIINENYVNMFKTQFYEIIILS